LAAIARLQPDLVLLDYRLPYTTGDALAGRLGGTVPLALISGDLVVEPVNDFLRIFSKPLDFDEMAAFIDQLSP
jgi:DNA-binding response OmpR family regulator